MGIVDNFKQIEDEIKQITESSGRKADEVKIVAVSKTFPLETVQEAIDSGISLLGENKIQEAKNKIPLLKGNFIIHMIGHLQSNKAKDAVHLFDLIHSIDKISTAQKIDKEAKKINKIQKILVQVNPSGEQQKNGIKPESAVNFIDELTDLENVEVCGLMCMAPFTDNEKIIRESFRSTFNLLNKINSSLNLNLKELSMGMSSDYKIAIEEGSTIVRIGTAIFGNRNYL